MTESPRTRHAKTVAVASVALFLVLLALMLWQLEGGLDPALGSASNATATQPVAKHKLIIHHRVIESIDGEPVVGAEGADSYSAPADPEPAPAPSTSAS